MPDQGLSERDICTKCITPAVVQIQVREEVGLTAGKVVVRGKLVARGKSKRADYVLYFKPGLPLAIIEAKDPSHSVGDGMQQALHGIHRDGRCPYLDDFRTAVIQLAEAA